MYVYTYIPATTPSKHRAIGDGYDADAALRRRCHARGQSTADPRAADYECSLGVAFCRRAVYTGMHKYAWVSNTNVSVCVYVYL